MIKRRTTNFLKSTYLVIHFSGLNRLKRGMHRDKLQYHKRIESFNTRVRFCALLAHNVDWKYDFVVDISSGVGGKCVIKLLTITL